MSYPYRHALLIPQNTLLPFSCMQQKGMIIAKNRQVSLTNIIPPFQLPNGDLASLTHLDLPNLLQKDSVSISEYATGTTLL